MADMPAIQPGIPTAPVTGLHRSPYAVLDRGRLPVMRILKVIAEGIVWATLGIALLRLTLPPDYLVQKPADCCGLLSNEFARRWDGTCSGWTQSLATFHVVNDLLLWTAYVIISLVMWRLHPIIKRVPTARITVPLICSVFLTCGAAHLFSAYVVFNPIYVFDGAFKMFAGVIGVFGALYVAHDLVTVFDKIEGEHRRLRVLEARLAGARPEGNDKVSQPSVVPSSTTWRVGRAMLEGFLLSLLGLLLWLPSMEPVREGLFRNNFACQWAGECAGWTKPLALLYVAGSFTTWLGYMLIGVVVFRLHPISKRVRMARLMVPMVSLVLITCGGVHLVEAYAIFNPIYLALGWLKLLVALVSLIGAVLVAQTLVTVFDVAAKDRSRLLELESKLAGVV